MRELPSITIATPTLNSAASIGEYAESILLQEYPPEKIEIVIADGGSGDDTLEILRAAGFRRLTILQNPLRTGEAGKAVCAKAATGEIIAFIDSDNILPQADWLSRMMEPFADETIIASEPLEYTWRARDGYITRYCALMGMNDPLCFFMGNYDRYNHISRTWTAARRVEEDKGSYYKVIFKAKDLPTIGANGFLIRRSLLEKHGVGEYLFDIDILYDILKNAEDASAAGLPAIAKVKAGIIHLFAGGFKSFIRKQNRRIRDYDHYRTLGLRTYRWGGSRMMGLALFAGSCLVVLPLFIQALVGFARKRDRAWFFHLPACIATLVIYAAGSLVNRFSRGPLSREQWS
ncbi:MAG: glycosyltransferase family 2 protein [Candidatus Omnitrophota bacterium]